MTELLYQTESYIQSFSATVTSIDNENRGVALDRTAFYPGGGGQPADQGTLVINNMTYPVSRAKKIGDQLYHYLGSELPLPTTIS